MCFQRGVVEESKKQSSQLQRVERDTGLGDINDVMARGQTVEYWLPTYPQKLSPNSNSPNSLDSQLPGNKVLLLNAKSVKAKLVNT